MTDTLPAKPLVKPGPTTTPLTETYWHHAEQGLLYLQQCGQCGRHQHYPGPMCRSCWSEELTWVPAAGTGFVWTFTVAGIPGHPAWSSETPYVLALVELDEGPRLMTNIVGCSPEHVHVGQRVQLRSAPFKPGQPPLQFEPQH
ncbi:OB-fold domain-containing protein [Mycobacterium sp. 21AC1]|uniref:Zn-ribbon domain-containing OB-fold protein n=1 Tax=[Mycobacterium] appelbergii TaxID=2939269 RepID=UPI00293920FE|nr:OB-fold domain-containing protein [Mycobacterium sp. 21AC1]MDV3125959.1 OB-fold domain-containing protein [Mycobacterium sp. 21AC1]